ncbi:MAG: type II secretion system protein [Alphaproteobacteria bacterium]
MNGPSRRRGGFTLVEAVAGVLLLALMLATVTVAFQRTVESVIDKSFQERAGAVAQRRLELLIASRQEPNTINLHGRDEFDPVFRWEVSLAREVVGNEAPRDDLSNTIIKAVVKVTSDSETSGTEPEVQMTRYFASLLPLPGFDVAVPLVPEQEEAPWYIELREKLGREPTIEETLDEMVRILELPPELLALGADAEDGEDEAEDPEGSGLEIDEQDAAAEEQEDEQE